MAQVQFLIRELRSCKPHGTVNKKLFFLSYKYIYYFHCPTLSISSLRFLLERKNGTSFTTVDSCNLNFYTKYYKKFNFQDKDQQQYTYTEK